MSDAPAAASSGSRPACSTPATCPTPVVGARAVPIYQTTSYVFDDADTAAQLFELKQYGNIYTRIGNPTTAVLEERLASLENATGAVAVASGMAAQFVALMTLLSPGDEIVASSHLYGGTVTQLTHTFRKLSLERALRGPHPARALGAGHRPAHPGALRRDGRQPARQHPRPRAAGARWRRSTGIPLIVDNTFATPYLCRPIDWGATIVLHSATKFIGGHGNSIGGAVLESGRFDYSHVAHHRGPVALVPRAPLLRHLRALRLPDEGARRDRARHRRLPLADQRVPAAAGPRDPLAPDGAARRQRARRRPIPAGPSPRGVGGLRRPRGPPGARAGAQVSRRAAGRRLLLRPPDQRRRRPGRRPPVHRRAAALLPPRQRGRRAQPGHPPRLDHAPAVERGGAGRAAGWRRS